MADKPFKLEQYQIGFDDSLIPTAVIMRRGDGNIATAVGNLKNDAALVLHAILQQNKTMRERIKRLRAGVKAACDHLIAEGVCDDVPEDEDEVYHCGDPKCTYCEMNRIITQCTHADLDNDDPGRVGG